MKKNRVKGSSLAKSCGGSIRSAWHDITMTVRENRVPFQFAGTSIRLLGGPSARLPECVVTAALRLCGTGKRLRRKTVVTANRKKCSLSHWSHFMSLLLRKLGLPRGAKSRMIQNPWAANCPNLTTRTWQLPGCQNHFSLQRTEPGLCGGTAPPAMISSSFRKSGRTPNWSLPFRAVPR